MAGSSVWSRGRQLLLLLWKNFLLQVSVPLCPLIQWLGRYPRWYYGYICCLSISCARDVIFISRSVTETYRITGGAVGASWSMCGYHHPQVSIEKGTCIHMYTTGAVTHIPVMSIPSCWLDLILMYSYFLTYSYEKCSRSSRIYIRTQYRSGVSMSL